STPDFSRTVGDQGRQQTLCAEFAMGRRKAQSALRRRLIVEQHISTAVHLQIDESRRQPCTRGQVTNGNSGREFAGRYEISDARTVDDDGCVLAHGGAVENVIGDEGLQLWLFHLVSVTFCRCRGRSTSAPRDWARRIASA